MRDHASADTVRVLTGRWPEVVFAAAGVGLLAWLLARGWAVGSGEHSDFAFFYHAANAARSGGDLYDVPGNGYWYPPLFAVVMIPLTWLPLPTAAHVWTLLIAASLATAGFVLASDLAGRIAPRADRLSAGAVAGAALLVLAEPWKTSFQFGNCDALIVLLCALGLRLLTRRPALAGLFIAAGASVKYFPLALLPFLLVRRRWAAAAGLLAGLAAFALGPALLLGWDRNLSFLARSWRGVGRLLGLPVRQDAAPLLSMTAEYNFSVPACVARGFESRPDSGWLTAGVTGGIALLTAAFIAAAYRATRTPMLARDTGIQNATSEGRTILGMESAAVLALGVIFAPQATYRQFTLLMPLVVLACVLVRFGHGLARWLAAISLLLMVVGVTSQPRWLTGPAFFKAWNTTGGTAACVVAFTVLCVVATLRFAATKRLMGRDRPPQPQ